jgi:hypothetical protein
MSTITETINEISQAAKPRQEMRVIKSIQPGQMIRQGDIYLVCISGMTDIKVFDNIKVTVAEYTKPVKTNKKHHQLVPGSTMGSRHMVDSKVMMSLNPTNKSSLVGPILRSVEAFEVTHPEHAHFRMPAGEYLVCYQLNDKTKERVKD